MQEFIREISFGVQITDDKKIVIFDVACDLEPFKITSRESQLLREWLEDAENHLKEIGSAK